MRGTRIIGDGIAFYHCVSRVVDRRKVFEGRDKEVFRKIMRNLERFMGVRVVTYCLMGNHFHLLVEVPDRESLSPLTEEHLRELLPLLHESGAVETVEEELDRARERGDEAWQAEILDRYERRRGSLSYFLKELKQRVTLYINKKLDRTGTLWEGRFKSLLVEGRELSLMTVAAYIDLNPVRAGLVKKPEDYRWCGYAEALSGTRGAKLARRGPLGSSFQSACTTASCRLTGGAPRSATGSSFSRKGRRAKPMSIVAKVPGSASVRKRWKKW